MISSAAFAAVSDSKILLSASVLTLSEAFWAALILSINMAGEEEVVDVVDDCEVGVEVELDGEVGVGVGVVDEVKVGLEFEDLVGVEVVDESGFAEDVVGTWFVWAKHLTARAPLVKQNVFPG